MRREAGQTTTEYGLILMIVSVAVLGILTIAAGSLTELYQSASDAVGSAVDSVLG